MPRRSPRSRGLMSYISARAISRPRWASPASTSMSVCGRRSRPSHLQVYRWQLTSVMSILHRATGIALSVGTILLVWWLGAASDGPEPYAAVQHFLGSWIGLLLLFGWSVSLYYHLCNGIRHLVWDTGYALELNRVYTGGWAVLGATAALTVVSWVVGLAHWAP